MPFFLDLFLDLFFFDMFCRTFLIAFFRIRILLPSTILTFAFGVLVGVLSNTCTSSITDAVGVPSGVFVGVFVGVLSNECFRSGCEDIRSSNPNPGSSVFAKSCAAALTRSTAEFAISSSGFVGPSGPQDQLGLGQDSCNRIDWWCTRYKCVLLLGFTL